ncbi:GNAT family N-acetyltransferase [Agrobacterium rubi]|uniref:GNAT family N-acetyltransferase n=2 Tax=Agrobacterium rubi TaxID=28099 RepID=UPI00399D4C3B
MPLTPLCPAGHLPLKEGDREDEGSSFSSLGAEDFHESISPPVGEMSGRTEGGKPPPLPTTGSITEPDFELGYSLSQNEWGQGYATEIASALRDWFFDQNLASKFVAFTHPDNAASQNVLTKIGMRCRMPMIIDGLECPTFEYSAQMRS